MVHVGSWDAPQLAARIAAACRRYGLDALERRRMSDALRAWTASERFAQVFACPRIYAEYPFCVDVRGLALEGSIDVLALDVQQHTALVIDYKTGTSGGLEELRARYALQARCYAYAVLRLGLADAVELVFVRPEANMQEVAYCYDAAQLEELEAAIANAR